MFAVIRLLSLLATATGLSDPVFMAFAFTHYLLALVYSKQRIARIIKRPVFVPALLLTVVAGVWIARAGFPELILYFGIHLTLNEVYVLNDAYKLRRGGMFTLLSISRFLLNGAIYLAVFREGTGITLNMVIAAFVTYAIMHAYCWRAIRTAQNLDILFFELIGFGFALWMNGRTLYFREVVAYHGFFWVFLPITSNWRGGFAWIFRFILAHAAVFGFFFFCITRQTPIQLSRDEWVWWTFGAGYMHVTLSFALSTLNPSWWVRLFQPMRTTSPETR